MYAITLLCSRSEVNQILKERSLLNLFIDGTQLTR
jgi:hypothetical protein